MDNEDWLDAPLVGRPDSEKAADGSAPGLPLGPQALAVAADAVARRAQFLSTWESLTDTQRVFLNTWRECRFNASKAFRVLANTTHHTSKSTVSNWLAEPGFEHVRTMLRSASVEEILTRDHLVSRQDDIAETALTPAPILHMGSATGHYEVDLGAANKANEILLRLGGHLKDKDIDLSVGIVGPSFVIQVVQPGGNVIDVTPQHVPMDLPAPEVADDEWV